MCSHSSTPKTTVAAPTPAPAAPTVQSAPATSNTAESTDTQQAQSAANGRKSLRIDLTQASTGSSSSGLNIPL